LPELPGAPAAGKRLESGKAGRKTLAKQGWAAVMRGLRQVETTSAARRADRTIVTGKAREGLDGLRTAAALRQTAGVVTAAA
jgi:hypothetical protein